MHHSFKSSSGQNRSLCANTIRRYLRSKRITTRIVVQLVLLLLQPKPLRGFPALKASRQTFRVWSLKQLMHEASHRSIIGCFRNSPQPGQELRISLAFLTRLSLCYHRITNLLHIISFERSSPPTDDLVPSMQHVLLKHTFIGAVYRKK